VTQKTHFQMSGLADVYRTSGPPADLIDALRDRRIPVIIDDARAEGFHPIGLWPPLMIEDSPEPKELLYRNYFIAEHFDEAATRLAMPGPARARWAYVPRQEPLDLPWSEVERRHFAEMKLAARRSDAILQGEPPPYAVTDIEEMAARASAHP
jgi:hypothetical protein